MRSEKLLGVGDQVRHAVREVLDSADEYHTVHKTRLLRTVDLLYKEAPSGKLLELGTSGFIPIVCERLFPDVEVHGTHFDTSRKPTDKVEFTVGNKFTTVKCYNHDLETGMFPVKDGTYDFVLCCEVLEHMEIDPMHMLSEINRVLRPGGTLLLTTPNITSSRALAKILSGVEPYFYMQYHKTREYHRHNYEYSAPTLSRVLTAAGFNAKVWSEDLFEDGLPGLVDDLRKKGYKVEEPGDNLIAIGEKTGKVVDRHPVGLYV
jgi:SAM-dependent methyltransferase